MQHRLPRKNPDGFSLIEMAIVLGIIGFMLGAVWITARALSSSNKVNQVVRQTTETVNTIRDRFVSMTTFPYATGTDVTDLFGEGTAPTNNPMHLLSIEMSKGAGVYTHAYGGAFDLVTMSGIPLATDPVNVIRVRLLGIPTAACPSIVAQLPAAENSVGIVQVNVNNNATPLNKVTGYTGPGGTPSWVTPWPMNPATIAAACNGSAAGTSAPNEIDIDFKLQP